MYFEKLFANNTNNLFLVFKKYSNKYNYNFINNYI